MKGKEKEVSENGNKVVWKGPKRIIVLIVGVIAIILLGMQVYASTNGYGNVFFMIKELITTGTLEGEKEIFSDKEITLSYKSIEIAEGVKLQANKLEIKENESTLCLHITADDENKVLPLTYEWMSEGLEKTEVKGSKETKGDFDERLTVKYAFVDDELMTLFVKDKDGKLLRELEINLGTHEIYVKGESEVEKISQIELKKYLNVFSELNNEFGNENDRILKVAINLDKKICYLSDVPSVEEINTVIKEFYGDKAVFVKAKNKEGKEIEVIDLDGKGFKYDAQANAYTSLTDEVEYRTGICLKINDIKYEDGIYTVKYIYTLYREAYVEDDEIEDQPQYEATIKLKVNKDAKYSKYQIVELSKGTEVKEKVTTEVNEDNNTTEKDLEGVWTDKREGESFYHEGIIKITNQTADSIDFELSAVNGRDVDHVNIGDVKGTAKKVGNEYVFEEKNSDYESKITIYLGDFEGTKAVVVKEKYSTENNPYAGHGVWFDGEYTKNNVSNKISDNCEHIYEVVLNSGSKASDTDSHTTLDGTHIERCSKCGTERRVPHNFEKWFELKNSAGEIYAYTLWCNDCKDYIYTTDYSVVQNSGYGMYENENAKTSAEVTQTVSDTTWKQIWPEWLGMKFKVPNEFNGGETITGVNNSKIYEVSGIVEGFKNEEDAEIKITFINAFDLDNFDFVEYDMDREVESTDNKNWSAWNPVHKDTEYVQSPTSFKDGYVRRTYARTRGSDAEFVVFDMKITGVDVPVYIFMGNILKTISSTSV